MGRPEIIDIINDSEISKTVRQKVVKMIRTGFRAMYTEDKKDIGKSKIGGTPDFPKEFDWPKVNEKYLSFIGQINFSELSLDDEYKELQKGICYIFYNITEQVWGFAPNDFLNWKVLFFEGEKSELKNIPFPKDFIEESKIKEKYLNFEEQFDIPNIETDYISGLKLNENNNEEYYNLYEEITEENNGYDIEHKVFGHSNNIQGEMEQECQLVSNGLYCGDGSGYNNEQSKELLKDSLKWKLLFQIDSDEDLNMEWGDMGKLYFWIKEEDLKNKMFANVWMVLQCG